jgi:CoA:oxalate CoA-transferase
MTERREKQTKPGAYDSVRVVELGALIAGPSCGKFLADHGADVIKVERFPLGDISRYSKRTSAMRSPMFLQHNAGKRSLCVDIKQPEGLDIVRQLIAKADVVIQAFTPGTMERLGLGYEALKETNPGVILCSISGFGQTGRNAKRPGYAHLSHSMTGWLGMQFLHRDPPELPRGPGIAIADTTTGLTAFGAIGAALYRKAMTGEGDHIDIALFDSLYGSNDSSLQTYLTTGEIDVWYHPVHATKNGYVTALAGPDHGSWQRTCVAMGKPDLAEDPRFRDQQSLTAHLDDAAKIMQSWLAATSSEEAERLLTGNHVPCGIVLTVDKAVRQPQVADRNLIVTVDDPLLGAHEQVNSAFKYENVASGVRGPAPMLGQHNAEVLRQELGYDDDRITRLNTTAVLRQERI